MEALYLQSIVVGKKLYPPGTEVSFQRRDGVHIRDSVLSLPIMYVSHIPPDAMTQNYDICLVDGSLQPISPDTISSIICFSTSPPTSQISQVALAAKLG
eukprot:13808738-Ditylum_brightwellii.AAC.1